MRGETEVHYQSSVDRGLLGDSECPRVPAVKIDSATLAGLRTISGKFIAHKHASEVSKLNQKVSVSWGPRLRMPLSY